jgi:phytoene dehydrogenase-like protein
MLDAVVVGSGPNGLAAAIELAQRGAEVKIVEAADEIGGGMRSAEVTLPGFIHDTCSAVHPLGILSPFFKTLPLEEHGLEWISPSASVAHPIDDEPAVMLYKSMDKTMEEMGGDGQRWKSIFSPLLPKADGLLADILGPLSIPKHPLLLTRFGLSGLRSATKYAESRFEAPRARAAFAGCAAHSILPLETPLTTAVGTLFALSAHMEEWPVARGGSGNIATALGSYFESLGGEIETSTPINHVGDLPEARVYLFDTDPLQLASIAESVLPEGYLKRIRNYRFGPGVFKLDWALDGPIPWKDHRCYEASTVHIGGTMEEIARSEKAAWDGKHWKKPFLILCQQSQFDSTRAPEGKHTGYAYCHVPAGSTRDRTETIENQIERFAPGFRDLVLARHTTNTQDFYEHNKNYVGGAIAGGAADMTQIFTRPVARLNPYTTPNPRLYICSASTPPGGGVHGMCGYHAARAAFKKIARIEPSSLVK